MKHGFISYIGLNKHLEYFLYNELSSKWAQKNIEKQKKKTINRKVEKEKKEKKGEMLWKVTTSITEEQYLNHFHKQ